MAIPVRDGADGKPRFRVQVASRNPETGKRHTVDVSAVGQKKIAESVERGALREIDLGAFAPPKVRAERDRVDTARKVPTAKGALDSWLVKLRVGEQTMALAFAPDTGRRNQHPRSLRLPPRVGRASFARS